MATRLLADKDAFDATGAEEGVLGVAVGGGVLLEDFAGAGASGEGGAEPLAGVGEGGAGNVGRFVEELAGGPAAIPFLGVAPTGDGEADPGSGVLPGPVVIRRVAAPGGSYGLRVTD